MKVIFKWCRVGLRSVAAILVLGLVGAEFGFVSPAVAADEYGTCAPSSGRACIANITDPDRVYENEYCSQGTGEDCWSCEVAEGFHCIKFGSSVAGYKDWLG